MRAVILPLAVWIGALQVGLPNQSGAESLSAAVALAGITVMVYRLGVWRQEMVNTKHNIAAEIAQYRRESAEQYRRLEQRFTAVEKFIEAATQQRIGIERWQGRVDTTLDSIGGALNRIANGGAAGASNRQGAA